MRVNEFKEVSLNDKDLELVCGGLGGKGASRNTRASSSGGMRSSGMRSMGYGSSMRSSYFASRGSRRTSRSG